jgi:DNA-binding CsgD family transcriptional regulator
MGELDGVEADVERLRAGDFEPAALDAALVHGEALLARGALKEAHAVLSHVLERQRPVNLPRAIRAAAGLVRIELARGETADAEASTERALAAARGKEIWPWAAPLVPFAPLDVLGDLVNDYRAGIANRDAPLAAAALDFADAQVAERAGDLSAAMTAYEKARLRYESLPDPRLAAHAGAAQGHCRALLGDPAGADLLRHAWDAFSELDAPWEADRVKQLARQAGVLLSHRRGRRGYGDELSPRERDIARRVAAGMTTPEIAQELFLSPRTVDGHVARVMRKLGVSSRRELADAIDPGKVT